MTVYDKKISRLNRVRLYWRFCRRTHSRFPAILLSIFILRYLHRLILWSGRNKTTYITRSGPERERFQRDRECLDVKITYRGTSRRVRNENGHRTFTTGFVVHLKIVSYSRSWLRARLDIRCTYIDTHENGVEKFPKGLEKRSAYPPSWHSLLRRLYPPSFRHTSPPLTHLPLWPIVAHLNPFSVYTRSYRPLSLPTPLPFVLLRSPLHTYNSG